MLFSPAKVVSILLAEFGSTTDASAPTRDEKKIAERFAAILRDCVKDQVDVETDESLDSDVSDESEWNHCDGDSKGTSSDNKENLIYFGDAAVSGDQVTKAIDHYRSSSKGHRSLTSMNARFRWIKEENHLRKLRKIESEYRETAAIRACRSHQLKKIGELLHEDVKSKLAEGIILHDNDLGAIALNLCRQHHIDAFKASPSWTKRFKRHYGIVSRKITAFVTKRSHRSREEIESRARDFVRVVREDIRSIPLACFCNGDQSGFVREMTTGRSLTPGGVRKVERVVESRAALTHSYTVLPLLYADGKLGEKLYVVLQEKRGSFPRQGHFEAPNLVVRAATSHIMTKDLMIDWIKTCLFHKSDVQQVYLIVDSWSSFRDINTIEKSVPEGCQITVRNIPPGATSLIQPLDVYFFGPMKNVMKKIRSCAVINNVDFNVTQRDNTLKILSQVYRMLCAPRFSNFLKYSWYKAGYVDEHPGAFVTPAEYLFNLETTDCFANNCREPASIRCAICEQHVCFTHFFALFHQC